METLLGIVRKHLTDVDQHGYVEGEDDVVMEKELKSLMLEFSSELFNGEHWFDSTAIEMLKKRVESL